jgi:hypothetical protein
VELQLNSFLTSALEGGVWSASRPGRLYPWERHSTHCTGGWVGPGAGLNRCGKPRPTESRSPDLPARSESLYRLSYPSFAYIIIYNRTQYLSLIRVFVRPRDGHKTLPCVCRGAEVEGRGHRVTCQVPR